MLKFVEMFRFLEAITGKKTPFVVKLLLSPNSLTQEDLDISGDLDLYINSYEEWDINWLPDNLTVGGNVDLDYLRLNKLPDNLTVGGSLTLRASGVSEIPIKLKVNKNLAIHGTPLSFKHSSQQIRDAIEKKGGYVNGKIYM